ncbi:MAG: carbohydrate ABC transporter permease, partial [Clostridia bacterium]
QESRIWIGYRNTILYTVLGTLFNLCLTIPAGYVLSKKHLIGRKILTFYFLVTMYFGGGMIPTYLVIKSMGLINQPYTLVILGGISVYNLIITRVFFQSSIPEEIYEAVNIDGANEFLSFFRIALPLAKPIIAVMALYYSVGHWNAYFDALLYVSRASYQPLQMILRSILVLNESALAMLDPNLMEVDMVLELTRRTYLAETMKYALIFIASAPLLALYPFVQKYFVKGVMIGSLKG